MDCTYCMVEPATNYRVRTHWGYADLCDACAARYARPRPWHPRPIPHTRPGRDLPGQMYLPIYATGGHGTAAGQTS